MATGNPTHRLDEPCAFTVATSIWRIAEKAEKEGRLSTAAAWYLLGVEPIFCKMGSLLQGKLARFATIRRTRGAPLPCSSPNLRRKSVLTYVQLGDTDAAQSVLQAPVLHDNYAKNHFVRFCAAVSNVEQGE